MRFLFLLFLVSTPAFGQKKDSFTGPVNVVDSVYIPLELCQYDTIARLHQQVTFTITDSSSCNYSFLPGSSSYLELIIKTKNCTCTDCSYYRKFIIELSSISETMELAISPSNLTKIWWNSWRMPTKENNRSGTLKITDRLGSLKLLPYHDKKSNVLIQSEEFNFVLNE